MHFLTAQTFRSQDQIVLVGNDQDDDVQCKIPKIKPPFPILGPPAILDYSSHNTWVVTVNENSERC